MGFIRVVRGSVAVCRRIHPLDLIQQGNAGRQIHLLLFVIGQLVTPGVNLTELGLDLLKVVLGNAVGQLGDQRFDGTYVTDKCTRRTGISRDITAGIVMLMGTGQRSGDAAAVLCTRVGTQSRFFRLSSAV